MLRSLALALAAVLAMPVPAHAETPLKLAEISRQLYAAGVAAGDPLLVAAAAKLRKGLGAKRTDRLPDGGEAGTTRFDARTMLDTARKLSADNPAMLDLIEDIAAARTKGVQGGPVYNVARLGPQRTDRYDGIPFKGQAYAEIYLEAQDSSDLNLRIFDAQGRLVCSDTDASAIAYCGWQPPTDGSFSIAVENVTSGSVTYNMYTN